MHLAAQSGRGECIRLLLEHNANPLIRDMGGQRTPLDIARSRHFARCVKLLEEGEGMCCCIYDTYIQYAVFDGFCPVMGMFPEVPSLLFTAKYMKDNSLEEKLKQKLAGRRFM